MTLPGTAQIRSILAAAGWAAFACIAPDAAVAEMENKTSDPNQTEITAGDAALYFGVRAADAASMLALDGEFATIAKAAVRNRCFSNNFYILLAIRRAENGRPGREFGILHPRCAAAMRRRPAETLDIQAGWAAATIIKNRDRWTNAGKPKRTWADDGADGFIFFLADRYCPASVDPAGNKHWKKNVSYYYKKIKTETADKHR